MPEETAFCPRCGGPVPAGASFCPSCGLDLRFLTRPEVAPTMPRAGTLSRLLLMAGAWGSALMALAILVMAATALWGAGLVLPEIGEFGVELFVIVPEVLVFLELFGSGAVLVYLLYLAAVIGSVGLLLLRSVPGMGKELQGDAPDRPSPLYAVSTLFFALLSFQMVYYLLLLDGVDTSGPSFTSVPLWAQLYLLLEASVWEEVVSRVLYLGLPMMVLAVLRGEGEGSWRRLLGNFELDRPAMALIFLSSGVFALAHLPSWDVFKLLPTFLVGLALGYLFVRYGLHAAIVLHFSFDYLSLPSAALGGTLPLLLTGLLVLAFSALGLPFILHYARAGLEGLSGRPLGLSLRSREPDLEGYVHLPRIVCPHCGHDALRIHGQGYECLRCHRRF